MQKKAKKREDCREWRDLRHWEESLLFTADCEWSMWLAGIIIIDLDHDHDDLLSVIFRNGQQLMRFCCHFWTSLLDLCARLMNTLNGDFQSFAIGMWIYPESPPIPFSHISHQVTSIHAFCHILTYFCGMPQQPWPWLKPIAIFGAN